VQMVVSQAWTLDDGRHADAYIAKSRAMDAFLRGQPGFVSRMLVRGVDDRTHFTNLRVFTSIDDYLAMSRKPAYADLIASLSEHVDVARYVDGYPREFTDVVIGPPA
jgi:hypothetical protein